MIIVSSPVLGSVVSCHFSHSSSSRSSFFGSLPLVHQEFQVSFSARIRPCFHLKTHCIFKTIFKARHLQQEYSHEVESIEHPP